MRPERRPRSSATLTSLQCRTGRPVLTRHCWVTGLPDCPGRWAGLLAQWRQDTDAGGWQGRVVYAVDDGAATVIVEAWAHARHSQPATG